MNTSELRELFTDITTRQHAIFLEAYALELEGHAFIVPTNVTPSQWIKHLIRRWNNIMDFYGYDEFSVEFDKSQEDYQEWVSRGCPE